ncbi:MAG: hypothetical protein QUT30_01065 [Acidobacteriota bacterium]|nr:hypothetical protein [Acidobacteriota bacterium]
MRMRILLVETASPTRVLHTARQILAAAPDPKPEISILCLERSRGAYAGQSGVATIPCTDPVAPDLIADLHRKNFDIVYAFWTGEKHYRRMKLLALRLKAAEHRLIAGDGNEFRFTWKALCRHSLFRLRHPLPTDHWDFVLPQPAPDNKPSQPPTPRANVETPHSGERILILQSAEPPWILEALDRVQRNGLFRNPRYTLFCRNRQEIIEKLRAHPMLGDIRLHSETQGSWKHLRELRQSRFDAILLFLTGDPSYWKLKLFAFLLGVPLRRMLIFNENIDCFFFNWSQWLGLIIDRMQSKPFPQSGSKWAHSARILVSLLLKSAMLPFRFFWLLLVWLWLRSAGWTTSRKNHDDASRLPLFPGS